MLFRRPRYAPAALCVLLIVSSGCVLHKPLRVCAGVNGDLKVKAAVDAPPIKSLDPLCDMTIADGSGGKIALIEIDGVLLNANQGGLYSTGENPVDVFRERLDRIARGGYSAVILRVNSPGGGAAACDMMRHDLERMKARCGIPVVACIMDVGCGGAYYIASAADVIIAQPNSVVGSLGVIFNRYALGTTLEAIIVPEAVKAGEFADLGSPLIAFSMPDIDTPVEERPDYYSEATAILSDVANELHARMINGVSSRRPRISVGDAMVFDGRIFSATHAQQVGLIDEIGYLDDAYAVARRASGEGNARIVMLHRPKDIARTGYALSPNTPLSPQVIPSIPGIDRAKLPHFLYLWQTDPALEKMGGSI